MNGSTTRDLIVVSGYYGFDNLGDEAILEELVRELKQLGDPGKIVVLSAQPQKTARQFGVQSQPRNDFAGLAKILPKTRLLISGGGGLFQDIRSPGSVMFYGWQMLMARALGAGVMVYAQGLGPLKGRLATRLTRLAFAQANAIAVRDRKSQELLASWGIEAQLTADPVWCLQRSRLPEQMEAQLQSIQSGILIALSLRQSPFFNESHFQTLLAALRQSLPAQAHLLLLPLMHEQDEGLLRRFEESWKNEGRACSFLDTASLVYPSQWLSLFSRCRLVVGMRLHALIMALQVGVGVVGIEYDTKVSQLLADFEQPGLILAKEPSLAEWQNTLSNAVSDHARLSRLAIKKAEGARKSACQNFNLLARILDVQKNG